MSIFSKFESKFLRFWDHVVVKIISSIFNFYLFDFSCLYVILIICCWMDIIIFGSIFFIAIHAFVVKKISTNSNVNCKKYWKQHNAQHARTTLIFMLIFISYFYFINIFSAFFNRYINYFFWINSFYSLNIHPYHMIYHIHTHNY